MKTKLIFIAFLFLSISMSAQWKPAGDKIKTAWAETLNLEYTFGISPSYYGTGQLVEP